MKIDNITLNKMQNDIRVILKHYSIDPKKINVNELNNFWFHTFMNRTYPDNHPGVKKDDSGKRILSFIDRDDYDLYPCGTNDTTVYTALNKILKNLQDE